MTKVNELASKHAKARAPSTTHDSSTEWQKQEQGEKGDVDSWEGDLLVLAVGNAQQAGGPRNHLFTSVMQLRDLLCPKCVSRGFRLLLTLGSCGVQLIASCMMLKHPICREVFPLLCALHFAAPCALVPQLHTNNNCRHWHLSKYLACMAYTCCIQLDSSGQQGICLRHAASLTPDYVLCAGGGMKMCPEAKIDDGLLDITYVQNIAPEKVPELMQTLAMGGRDNDDLAESIKTMRVPWLEVVTSHSVHAWLHLLVEALHKARLLHIGLHSALQ
jgi:hypothetical protein